MQFVYTAIDKDAQKQKGKLEANNEREVLEFLRQSNLTPITIRKLGDSNINILPSLSRVKTQDVVLFTRQLSSMTLTGLTLIESLKVLKLQKNRPKVQELINDIIVQISEGSSLSDALAQHKDVFSDLYIGLIKAAEAGGMLDKVLARLADNMEKSEDLKKRVKSAMFYPSIVVTGVVVVIVVMNIFVIPPLGTLYENLNLELPASTKFVLAMSKAVTTFYPIVILGLIGSFILFKRFKKTEAGIKTLDKIKLQLPVFGEIITLSVLDEITRTMSLLIASGASIIESLNITAGVANNIWYRNAIYASRDLVEKGIDLSSALGNQRMFPPILIQMIKVGESTGRIDESLLKVSEYFERDLDLKVKTLTTAIEPLLIVVLGVSVAFLILSVITPIYSLISQIQ